MAVVRKDTGNLDADNLPLLPGRHQKQGGVSSPVFTLDSMVMAQGHSNVVPKSPGELID